MLPVYSEAAGAKHIDSEAAVTARAVIAATLLLVPS